MRVEKARALYNSKRDIKKVMTRVYRSIRKLAKGGYASGYIRYSAFGLSSRTLQAINDELYSKGYEIEHSDAVGACIKWADYDS